MLQEMPAEETFVAETLTVDGRTAFRYIDNPRPDERHVYFINRVQTGAVSGAPMLLGQFVTEFEKCPEKALALVPGGTNRLYCSADLKNGGDRRVAEYHTLTPEEVADTRRRLAALSATNSKAGELLQHL